MTGTLATRLTQTIRQNGPLTIAQFMSHCLADPEHGYYRTREAIGANGDFITAPEVSQMFGELIGVWCLSIWHAAGTPAPVNLIELGPGRGTLMSDLLRATARDAGFKSAHRVHLVEISETLRTAQRSALRGEDVTWHNEISSVPAGFNLIIANEFFDALPIHQYIRQHGEWFERMVGLSAQDDLQFCLGSKVDPDLLPAQHRQTADGTIVETSPASLATIGAIGALLRPEQGAALLIDYGYLQREAGDTLQAVRQHQFANVFGHLGQTDLTAHVDFAALGQAARQAGMTVSGPVTQGDFLLEMGLLERAGQLGRDKSDAQQRALEADVDRLAGPAQMGTLFKVMGLANGATHLPGFG
jgi:SAM-dependent MidA family methyltransferase